MPLQAFMPAISSGEVSIRKSDAEACQDFPQTSDPDSLLPIVSQQANPEDKRVFNSEGEDEEDDAAHLSKNNDTIVEQFEDEDEDFTPLELEDIPDIQLQTVDLENIANLYD